MRAARDGVLAMTATEPQSAAASGPSHDEVLLRMSGMAKSFGATQALRNASFDLRAGEVHALVGENGSGKSTLVKILSGVHAPDSGSIEIEGAPVPAPGTPRRAQAHGIISVFQEILVAESRSVLDNVWLGVDHPLRVRVPNREKRERARTAITELRGEPLNLDTPVEELSLSDRQACCIVRALLRSPRILILDEATSALDVATRDRLIRIIGRLVAGGAGVIFITHRMDEVSEIGDRITVMRSGETVATLPRGGWTPSELVRLMTGSAQLTERARSEANLDAGALREVVLSARQLRLRPGREPFNVDVRAGELVGVAGLEGHGQEAFLWALRGAGADGGEVIRHEDGRDIVVRSVEQAAKHGVAYVPRERRQATFAWMSIRENFGMPTLDRDLSFRLLRVRATRRRLAEYQERLRIVLGRQEDRITTLSGGNQQKVVIARWLAADPRILLLNDPTRGIDIGAKHDLYRLLSELAAEGLAVIMLSTELDEHVELMDRVLVFREFELQREVPRAELSRESLVEAFFGEGERDDGAA
jgi:ABC-type sugar transport system ATPase subunit